MKGMTVERSIRGKSKALISYLGNALSTRNDTRSDTVSASAW